MTYQDGWQPSRFEASTPTIRTSREGVDMPIWAVALITGASTYSYVMVGMRILDRVFPQYKKEN